tara:strand:+ start:108 stop:593 length:486 start_codon:yes stop_codon:yes gene_type:complete
MKRLILLRHAKSSWSQPVLSDHERHLNQQGIGEAELIGAYINKHYSCPEYIVSSTAKRTLETIQIIAKQINYTNTIEQDPKIYGGQIPDILSIINNINNKYNSTILVGHNPTTTNIINHITNAKIDHVPTCGIAIIDFKCNWNLIKQNGQLIDFIYPTKIK